MPDLNLRCNYRGIAWGWRVLFMVAFTALWLIMVGKDIKPTFANHGNVAEMIFPFCLGKEVVKAKLSEIKPGSFSKELAMSTGSNSSYGPPAYTCTADTPQGKIKYSSMITHFDQLCQILQSHA